MNSLLLQPTIIISSWGSWQIFQFDRDKMHNIKICLTYVWVSCIRGSVGPLGRTGVAGLSFHDSSHVCSIRSRLVWSQKADLTGKFGDWRQWLLNWQLSLDSGRFLRITQTAYAAIVRGLWRGYMGRCGGRWSFWKKHEWIGAKLLRIVDVMPRHSFRLRVCWIADVHRCARGEAKRWTVIHQKVGYVNYFLSI